MIKKRKIIKSLFLTIITCGIYGIVWIITLTDDTAKVSDEDMSGGMVLLFNIITLGIYSIYWSYKMGKAIKIAADDKNINLNDNSILYLILQLFGCGIVNYCLMQSELNLISDN